MRGHSAFFVFIIVIMFAFYNHVPMLCVLINLMWQIVDRRGKYFKNYSEQAFRLFL